ncbi:hypothetical protein ACFU5O_27865 [Streptomyces sp. NPDC057445]|uniref:hypothetical protein n=1 Tax=Streptomyces sp. NPDC057445 TaxID=3346136 RepID=UPI00369FD905
MPNAVTQDLCSACVHAGEVLPQDAVPFTRVCPACGSARVVEFGVPIPGTDDRADAARCEACRLEWCLNPAADGGCTFCGGSGYLPPCTNSASPCPCREDYQQVASAAEWLAFVALTLSAQAQEFAVGVIWPEPQTEKAASILAAAQQLVDAARIHDASQATPLPLVPTAPPADAG